MVFSGLCNTASLLSLTASTPPMIISPRHPEVNPPLDIDMGCCPYLPIRRCHTASRRGLEPVSQASRCSRGRCYVICIISAAMTSCLLTGSNFSMVSMVCTETNSRRCSMLAGSRVCAYHVPRHTSCCAYLRQSAPELSRVIEFSTLRKHQRLGITADTSL